MSVPRWNLTSSKEVSSFPTFTPLSPHFHRCSKKEKGSPLFGDDAHYFSYQIKTWRKNRDSLWETDNLESNKGSLLPSTELRAQFNRGACSLLTFISCLQSWWLLCSCLRGEDFQKNLGHCRRSKQTFKKCWNFEARCSDSVQHTTSEGSLSHFQTMKLCFLWMLLQVVKMLGFIEVDSIQLFTVPRVSCKMTKNGLVLLRRQDCIRMEIN